MRLRLRRILGVGKVGLGDELGPGGGGGFIWFKGFFLGSGVREGLRSSLGALI